jgi:hypothetical protein
MSKEKSKIKYVEKEIRTKDLIKKLHDFGVLSVILTKIIHDSDLLCTTDTGDFRKRFENRKNILLEVYKESMKIRSALMECLDICLPEEDQLYPLPISRFYEDDQPTNDGD